MSRRESPRRNTLLDDLRAKHKQRYDAVDGAHWGCICDDGAECLIIVVIATLNKSEQEVIRLLRDLQGEYDLHKAEIRKLTSEIAGLETYNRNLKRECDRLEKEKASATDS